jgi:MarR family transcriptional repressor of emrRAB
MSRGSVPADSFSAVEARIAVTRRRLPQFPVRYATLIRLTRHITKRAQEISNLALKPFGLNMGSYNTLMMLYGTEDNRLNASDLAEATGEKRTNITRICDELVARGLIARVAGVEDRRSVVVSLTSAGERLVENLQPVMGATLQRFYSGLSVADMDQLQGLLRRQLTGIEAVLDEAGKTALPDAHR